MHGGGPEAAGRYYESTFRSFARIVDLGREKADFMVISGDIYDDLYETPRTRLFFASELKRFGKPCFIVTGNHDAVHNWSSGIPYPPNVRQFGTSPGLFRMKIRGRDVEVAGISFDGPHTDENLAARLRGTPGYFTVGVVHCSVGPGGNGYAPCTLNDLLGKDIQYWALGHIHKREVLRGADPMVVYPGNIQGRDVSESGPKGCMLVGVEGNTVNAEFVPTQEILWEEVKADITGKTTVQELVDFVKGSIPEGSVAGLDVIGAGNLDHIVRKDPEGLADHISMVTGADVTVRSIACRPDIDLGKAAEGGTLLSGVLRASEEYSKMTDAKLLDLLCSKGPAADLRPYLEYYAEHGTLHRIVEEAELSLVDRLAGADE